MCGPYRCQLIETGKEFIERHDQLLSSALRGQAGETLDVCKQDTEDENKRKTFLIPNYDQASSFRFSVEILTSATVQVYD